jgi:hypothetical protein
MGYLDVIKDGFKVVHRIWQLLLVQLGMVVLSGIGFIVLVVIPLAIAFVLFSIDLTGIAAIEDILKLLKEPSDIISKYFGLVLIVIGSLLIYIVLAATFSIYVFGGSVGVIGKALRDKTLKFSMHIFFSEAKRLFFPMLGFTSVVGVILIATAFVLGVLGGGIVALISFVKSQDSTLALFLSLFFSLLLIIIALILFLGIFSMTMYGIAVLVMKEIRPVKAFREAAQFVVRHPNAFWFYTLLFGGYIFVSFLLILLGYPFDLVPVIGPFLSFPYQIISSAFQTYIGLSIIAALFNYYYSTEISKGIPDKPIVEGLPSQIQSKEGTNTQNS